MGCRGGLRAPETPKSPWPISRKAWKNWLCMRTHLHSKWKTYPHICAKAGQCPRASGHLLSQTSTAGWISNQDWHPFSWDDTGTTSGDLFSSFCLSLPLFISIFLSLLLSSLPLSFNPSLPFSLPFPLFLSFFLSLFLSLSLFSSLPLFYPSLPFSLYFYHCHVFAQHPGTNTPISMPRVEFINETFWLFFVPLIFVIPVHQEHLWILGVSFPLRVGGHRGSGAAQLLSNVQNVARCCKEWKNDVVWASPTLGLLILTMCKCTVRIASPLYISLSWGAGRGLLWKGKNNGEKMRQNLQ